MTSPDLDVIAEAYRGARERYWVRRRIIGEANGQPLGVTDVIAEDRKTILFTGPEPDAKGWLDRHCLEAAFIASGADRLNRIALALKTPPC